MKILQLVTKRQYRGAEVFAANLSEELIGFGHEILFTGLYKNDKDVLTVENAENVDLSNGKTSAFSIRLLRSLISLLQTTKPDVVQCNGSDTLKYMVAASYFIPKVPIVYRNISMISEWIANIQKKILYKNLFKRVSHVSSVGDEAIADFINTFNYPKKQTSVIRRGIPIIKTDKEKEREKLQNQFNLRKDDKIVMHIGNFSPEKNHIFLLDIFSELKKEQPHIKLVLVGNGVLYETIKDEVKAQHLEDTVFLTGFRKDIPELLASSDLFVLCSKVEGVPGVILEAAVQEKPSVATNVGGVLEVLKNNETGFIIDDFDKQEFRNKIIKLATDDDLRKSLGEKAYSLVLKEYNPLKNARRFEKLYTDLFEVRIKSEEDIKNKKLRILQIIQKKQYRGAEIFCCQLSNQLLDLGNEVKIISIYEGDASLPFKKEVQSLKRPINHRYYDFVGWRNLNKVIKKFNPDIIQANAADTLKYAIFSKIFFRWKVPIVFRNASTSSFYIKNLISKKLNSFLLKKTDYILSVSKASKKDINNLFPFTTNKSAVIPVGIEKSELPEIYNDRIPFDTQKKNILHIGSFSQEKNHIGLINIFKEVYAEVPSAVLHLIGDGPLQANVKKLIQKFELDEAIILHGELKNPYPLLKEADLLVLPSFVEGLPAVILEAMHFKIPVVAYNVGGINEIVGTETGSLIEAFNEEEFAKSVIKNLKFKNQSQINKAHKMVIKNYLNDRLALKFVKSYKELLLK